MSLDVYLINPHTINKDEKDYYADLNITHNCNKMAMLHKNAYEAIWGGSTEGYDKAWKVIPVVESLLTDMVLNSEKYKLVEVKDWGSYNDFLLWLINLLEELRKYPHAIIETSR